MPTARHRVTLLVAVLSVLMLAGCTVSPPPAPQSTETTQTPPPPPARTMQIIMAIDAIGAGFNPHLLSDQSSVNAAVAALVLPSSHRPIADPDTPTGYAWSSSSGPDATLQSGTVAAATVAVEQQRPLALVIPALRRWTGVGG